MAPNNHRPAPPVALPTSFVSNNTAQIIEDARSLAAFLQDYFSCQDDIPSEDSEYGAFLVFRLLRDKLDLASGKYVLPKVGEGAE